MIVLLDNTVLSNFAVIGRTDLLRTLLGSEAASTPQVLDEFRVGVLRGRLPETDWGWLTTIALSGADEQLYEQLSRRLNKGEASCLAVAAQRAAKVLTDDRDARAIAGRMGIAVSGTLGVLL